MIIYDSWYIIVKATNLENLIKEVNAKLKEGFIPQGGVAINTEIYYIYNQAMFREKTKT